MKTFIKNVFTNQSLLVFRLVRDKQLTWQFWFPAVVSSRDFTRCCCEIIIILNHFDSSIYSSISFCSTCRMTPSVDWCFHSELCPRLVLNSSSGILSQANVLITDFPLFSETGYRIFFFSLPSLPALCLVVQRSLCYWLNPVGHQTAWFIHHQHHGTLLRITEHTAADEGTSILLSFQTWSVLIDSASCAVFCNVLVTFVALKKLNWLHFVKVNKLSAFVKFLCCLAVFLWWRALHILGANCKVYVVIFLCSHIQYIQCTTDWLSVYVAKFTGETLSLNTPKIVTWKTCK